MEFTPLERLPGIEPDRPQHHPILRAPVGTLKSFGFVKVLQSLRAKSGRFEERAQALLCQKLLVAILGRGHLGHVSRIAPKAIRHRDPQPPPRFQEPETLRERDTALCLGEMLEDMLSEQAVDRTRRKEPAPVAR